VLVVVYDVLDGSGVVWLVLVSGSKKRNNFEGEAVQMNHPDRDLHVQIQSGSGTLSAIATDPFTRGINFIIQPNYRVLLPRG
jgi:hypothetical protein